MRVRGKPSSAVAILVACVLVPSADLALAQATGSAPATASASPSTKAAAPATAAGAKAKSGAKKPAAPAAPRDLGWPRLYTAGGAEILVQQPQVDSWEDYAKLSMRVAVSVKAQGSSAPEYGVVDLESRTVTDHANRTVTMYKPEIKGVRFPQATPEKAAVYEKAVRSISPARESAVIALDRVLAYVKLAEKDKKGIAVNLDPPPIFYADAEALLLAFLGPPRFVKIEGSSLEFGMNTSWDLIRDPKDGIHYLLYRDGWIQAPDLKNGPWTATKKLPKELQKLPKGGAWDRVTKNVPGKEIQTVPKVFVSETPSELILTKGRPAFEEVPGTQLAWVTNSQNTLFFHKAESRFYFLAAGRWFSAAELAGPWKAATTSLPPDFAAIPKSHKKASVLASVPGTREAEDAILIASIPRVGVVDRAMAQPEVSYDGEPKFEPIEGTTVSAAVNTPNDVFKVGEDYYCCFQGVWFKAAGGVFAAPGPTGPWKVADSVPKEIYAIPPTSPKHNVTYVTIVDSTPDTVTDSYTSGYEGEVVSSGVVMFGVGVAYGYGWGYPWYYPPYYWGWGMYPPYYGGVTFWAGAYGYGWSAYGPYGGAGYGARYNPATGVYSRGGYAYGPGGAAAWRTGYNPSTGTWAGQRGGANAYGSWKQGAVTNGSDWARGGSISNSQGTLRGFQTSGGAAGIGGSGSQGSGFVVKDKARETSTRARTGTSTSGTRTGTGRPPPRRRIHGASASTLDRGAGGASASTMDRGSSGLDAGTRDSLNSDYSSRQSGSARASSYSSGRSSYGGGRSMGGGGRRR